MKRNLYIALKNNVYFGDFTCAILHGAQILSTALNSRQRRIYAWSESLYVAVWISQATNAERPGTIECISGRNRGGSFDLYCDKIVTLACPSYRSKLSY